MDNIVKKTCMPLIAGILNIAIGLIILTILFLFAIAPVLLPMEVDPFVDVDISFDLVFLIAPGLIIGGLAIAGGIFAILRKRWGWALAGSIAAALNPLPFGIVAVILVILSKKEFG